MNEKQQNKNPTKNSKQIITTEYIPNESLGGLPIEIWLIIIGCCGFLEKAALKRCCRAFNMEISENEIVNGFGRSLDETHEEWYMSNDDVPKILRIMGQCSVNCGNTKMYKISVWNSYQYLKKNIFENYPFILKYENRVELFNRDQRPRYRIWLFNQGYISMIDLHSYDGGCYKDVNLKIIIRENNGNYQTLFCTNLIHKFNKKVYVFEYIDLEKHINIRKINNNQLDQIKKIFNEITRAGVFSDYSCQFIFKDK